MRTTNAVAPNAIAKTYGTKVYLAGPMRGLPEYNFPQFDATASDLRWSGFEVWSPAEHDREQGFDPTKDEALPLREYMKVDLPQVMEADWVCVLPGWENSEGAQLEVSVARRCGIPVLSWPKLMPVEHDGSSTGLREFITTNVVNAAAPWVGDPLPETVLEEADRIVATDRQGDYGHPLDDFAKVVDMANALWGRGPETPEEHALYMILVKVSREAHKHKRDNLVDIAGYAKTIDLIHEERDRVLRNPSWAGGAAARQEAEASQDVPGASREQLDGSGGAEDPALAGRYAGEGRLLDPDCGCDCGCPR